LHPPPPCPPPLLLLLLLLLQGQEATPAWARQRAPPTATCRWGCLKTCCTTLSTSSSAVG
jgi:hypothetical protein